MAIQVEVKMELTIEVELQIQVGTWDDDDYDMYESVVPYIMTDEEVQKVFNDKKAEGINVQNVSQVGCAYLDGVYIGFVDFDTNELFFTQLDAVLKLPALPRGKQA